MCLTWDYSSRTRTLYYNGVNIGSATTPSGIKFSVATGSIVLGQYHNTYKMEADFYGATYAFGGEMTNLNILKRKLTDEEVAKMYRSGICSSYEDSLETDIHLSWNTLLSDETEKHGNVAKFNLTCPDHTHEPTTAIPTTEKPTTEITTTEKPTSEKHTTKELTSEKHTTKTPTTETPTEESNSHCNKSWAFLLLPDFYNQVRTAFL